MYTQPRKRRYFEVGLAVVLGGPRLSSGCTFSEGSGGALSFGALSFGSGIHSMFLCLFVAVLLLVVSGVYIFGEPLRKMEAEDREFEARRKAAAELGASGSSSGAHVNNEDSATR